MNSIRDEIHQPHILRSHLNEWCGGTEPPTIVTVDVAHGEATVDIYDDDRYVHEGIVAKPVYTGQFLHDPESAIDHDLISQYAASCIANFLAENTGK